MEQISMRMTNGRNRVVAVTPRHPGRRGADNRDTIAGVHVATADEGRALFDRRARAMLGISGTEFLRRWDAGEYRPVPDTTDGRKIRRLVMLIPFARRTNT